MFLLMVFWKLFKYRNNLMYTLTDSKLFYPLTCRVHNKGKFLVWYLQILYIVTIDILNNTLQILL